MITALHSQTGLRLGIIATLLIVGTLIGVLFSSEQHPFTQVGGRDGQLGGDFTLRGVDGKVSLADFRGKTVVLYFGFLNCEEVCLNSMTVLQSSLLRLEESELEQVRVMLISIDPARDTKEDLAAFAARYHRNMIGLTGSQRQIDAVTADYGAHFEITDEDRQDPGYFFRHSSRYYIINSEGELVDAMRHSTTPNELIARVRELLS